MSVNNSLSEHPEDTGNLPDLYNRELMRKKTIVSQSYCADDKDVGENGGGYRDWKAKNNVDSVDRMMSSLGKALHNQGVVAQNDSDHYNMAHYHDTHSSSMPNSEYRGRVQHESRLNSSEPYYAPHQYRGPPGSNEIMYRQSNQLSCRPELNGHYNERQSHQQGFRSEFNGHQDDRQYYQPNRDTDQNCLPEEQFDTRYGGQCCPGQNVNSSVVSPKNNQNGSYQREIRNRNRSANNSNVARGEHQCRDHEIHQESRGNHGFNRSPCRAADPCRQVHSQSHQVCHPPPNCHCCQNVTEAPHRPDSPRKKSDPKRKTDASIKKLYRILWLQNEQLGLLERQVSKLIEINFSKESEPSEPDPPTEKPNTQAIGLIKPETSEIGIMTDLPCPHCVANEELSSSDSELETTKKSAVEDSLMLNGVEIPVNGADMNSPPVSMHIDLHEYPESSSCEMDESDTSEEESEPVGWTFYDNVVGQVNNILKTATTKKKAQKKKKGGYNGDLKQAVEQLRRLGLAPSEYDNNPKRVTFEEGLKEQQVNLRTQSEVSMNFNALASKYLSSAGGKVQDISMCNVISSSTNMSMATMRYLERHQIANRDVMDALSKKNPGGKGRKSRSSGDNAVTSKFLDITAIRQQPKLLPKDI